jgi:hypothetical protein
MIRALFSAAARSRPVDPEALAKAMEMQEIRVLMRDKGSSIFIDRMSHYDPTKTELARAVHEEWYKETSQLAWFFRRRGFYDSRWLP